MSIEDIAHKDKSKKRKESALDGDEENVKSRKKDKKEKKKQESGDGISEVQIPSEPSESKKDKKRRKKEKENTEQEPGNESQVNETASDAKKEKRKKRKHVDEDTKETSDASLLPKDKKKKKRSKGEPEKTKVDDNDNKEPESSERKKKKKTRDHESVLDSQTAESTTLASTSAISSDSEISSYLTNNSINIDYGTKEVPNELKPILQFPSLFPRIPSQLHAALSKFNEPTPIQACSWPALLAGRDVVGIAETGSGKTLAFGIPALAGLFKSKSSKKQKKASVLVLAPTRELAIQTHETFSQLGEPHGLKSVALFGGVDKAPQRRALNEEGATMVVGTPGRILDLINEGACDLSGVNYLVLDEADRMLDKGFENDIRTIIGHTSTTTQRQTLMFSATWPDAVRRLASTFQKNPVRVTVGSDDLTANRRVEQVVEVFDDTREKDSRLASHLRTLKARKGGKQSPDELRILVFVLYKKEAARVEQNLQRQGFSVGGIHGDLSQQARMAALDAFKSGATQLLVATDVAARGLDIPNVGTVINYSFPLTIEDYIHRIGRTGRGGKSGKSITFFTGDNHERALAGELAKVLRESGFDFEPLKKFPMTIKKKTHSAYGAFFREDIPMDAKPTRMTF